MNILKRIFNVKDVKKANFTVVQDGQEVSVHAPLTEEVKRVQHEYVQSLLALGRASAYSRRNLAAMTLENIHGK